MKIQRIEYPVLYNKNVTTTMTAFEKKTVNDLILYEVKKLRELNSYKFIDRYDIKILCNMIVSSIKIITYVEKFRQPCNIPIVLDTKVSYLPWTAKDIKTYAIDDVGNA